MTAEQWVRVREGFERAVALAPAERRDLLAQLAASDPVVATEIDALLHAHDDDAGAFLDAPAVIDPRDLIDPADDHPGTWSAAAPGSMVAQADDAPLPPGTRIGEYEIRGEIGRGGMGVVYLAQDLHLTRLAALKALPERTSRDAARIERLRREAQAAAAIAHPGVAMVYALLDTTHGTFIASEFIQGRSLREELRRGALEAARALRIAIDIARALCAAHDAQVVHRDLKPENVLLTPAGGVKVIDFGIARLDRPDLPSLTAPGLVHGTPGYMAPEQFVADGTATVDARVDIYALGVMLAEMVLGRHPYERSTADLPAGVAPIVRRSMAPDPERRYRTIRDVLADLERAARVLDAGESEPPAPVSRSTAVWWWQFHQAATALVYWLMAVPAWHARPFANAAVPGAGRVIFFVTLGALILASILRLHLWFTVRHNPGDLPRQLRQERPWILGADGLFTLSLIAGGLLVGDARMPLAVLLLAVGIGAWVIALFVEPSTTRAAFRGALD